jgi:hypothetical protein
MNGTSLATCSNGIDAGKSAAALDFGELIRAVRRFRSEIDRQSLIPTPGKPG